MKIERSAIPDVLPGHSRARVEIRAGRPVGLTAEVDVTSGGLVAVGVLVSAILLSTGVLVRMVRPARQELQDCHDG